MNKLKKAMGLMVALAMVVAIMAGCAGQTTTTTATTAATTTAGTTAATTAATEATTTAGTTEGTTTAVTTAETTSGEPRPNIVENPDNPFTETVMDLGGRTIKIGTPWIGDFEIEEGETELTAVALKRLEILKWIGIDYNCKFEVVDLSPIEWDTQELAEQLALAKSSGDVYVDILDHQSNLNPGPALPRDYLYPLSDINVINSQMDKFNIISKGTTYKGKIYGVNYESPFGSLRHMLLYNKTLAAKYNIENLYDLVRNKQWNFDKFLEVSESVYDQSGGDVSSIVTLYGMPTKLYEQFMAANDAIPYDQVDGKLVSNIDTEKGLRAMQFFTDMISKGLFDMSVMESTDEDPAFYYFINGNSMFFTAEAWMIGWVFEEMEDEFGILPMPMGPDATSYVSMYDVGRYWSIVDNGGNAEEVGAVFMALAKRSGDYYPDIDEYEPETWQEDVGGSTWDEESVEMTQILIDNMKMNYVTQLTEEPDWYEACEQMAAGELTPKEAVAGIAQQIQAALDVANQ